MSSNELNIKNIYQIPPFTTGFGKNPISNQVKLLAEIATKIAQNADFELIAYEGFEEKTAYNYGKVVLGNAEEEIFILCNRFVTLLAFAKEISGNTVFVEKAEWEKWIPKPFEILKPDYLAIRPDADDPVAARALALLDYSEFAEIVYQMPETIGEIVFNHWQRNNY